MGGNVTDFYSANMFDFDDLRASWMAMNGIKDEPTSSGMTAEQLDKLWADIDKSRGKNGV